MAGRHLLVAITSAILGICVVISSSSPSSTKSGKSLLGRRNWADDIARRAYWTRWGNEGLADSAILDLVLDHKEAKKYMDTMKETIDTLKKLTGLPEAHLGLPDKDIRTHPLDIIKYTYEHRDAEAVHVISGNGYNLTMWRIPCRNCDPKKPPVLMMHGLLMSGGDWIYLEKDSNLAFMLVNEGHTVYLGNARGNLYSQGHTKAQRDGDWNPEAYNSAYWRFGVHEMGAVDLPALIAKIRELHNGSKINYVGYSMGTTQYLIYKSEHPEQYEKDINKCVLMAPAAFISNLKSPLLLLILAFKLGSGILPSTVVSLHQLLAAGQDGPVSDSVSGLTAPLNLLGQILTPILVPQEGERLVRPSLHMLLVEGGPVVKNRRAFELSLGHQPCGGSLRTVNHFIQLYKTGLFQRYQFQTDLSVGHELLGRDITLVNASYSGEYAMVKDAERILVLYGRDDSLVVPTDALATATTMTDYYCEIPDFNHLDFQLGNNTEVRWMNTKVLDWFKMGSTNWNSSRCYTPGKNRRRGGRQ